MRSFFTRKRVLAITVVAVLAVTAAAVAYWTTNGTGTGSATTGTSTAVTINQLGSITNLKPGSPPQAVDFEIVNGSTENQHVSAVAVSISSVTGPNITVGTPCAAADFAIVQPSAINLDLTPGTHSYSPSGATLALTNSASNQDGCKGATVNLAFNAS